jgi:hypothetical protein
MTPPQRPPGRSGHDAGALHTNLRPALPKGAGADIRDMRQQPRQPRCGGAVAVEYGIVGAGRAWGIVHANRIALCPGHIIFAISRGCRVACRKGGTALHPHIARNDGHAVCLIQKGNGDIGVKLAQLEIWRVKDMAIAVVSVIPAMLVSARAVPAAQQAWASTLVGALAA